MMRTVSTNKIRRGVCACCLCWSGGACACGVWCGCCLSVSLSPTVCSTTQKTQNIALVFATVYIILVLKTLVYVCAVNFPTVCTGPEVRVHVVRGMCCVSVCPPLYVVSYGPLHACVCAGQKVRVHVCMCVCVSVFLCFKLY